MTLLVAAPCCRALSPAPARQAIFLDRSGSMRAYYASGLVRSIAAPLERTVGEHGNLQEYAFSTAVSSPQSLTQIDAMPFGEYTFLDKVIDACEQKHLPIAWIVTDNIEDTGEIGNTDRFYTKLRGEELLRVTVFPVLAQPGQPGLIVYALLFDQRADAEYDQTLSGFAQQAAGVLRTEPLRMKPVNRDTIEVTTHSLTPLTRRGRTKVYDTGVPIHESVEVQFKSRFDHIQIVDSALRVVPGPPTFQRDSLLVPERRGIEVTPDRIRELGPGDQTTQIYLLTVDIGRVRLKSTPEAWWKAAWGKPNEEGQLDLRFEIDVPQSNFRLNPQFLSLYSAGTVQQARATGKVYAIDQLLSQVNAGNTRIEVSSPVYFRVKYPAWPAILWLLILAALVGLAALLVVLGRRLFASRAQAWEVTATAAGGYALEAKVEGDRVIVEGEPLARIERNSLIPLGSTRLAGGQPRVKIEAGTPIAVSTRRNEMQLLFTPKSARETAASKSERPVHTGPIRRR